MPKRYGRSTHVCVDAFAWVLLWMGLGPSSKVNALPTYPSTIPNGARVPCPAHFTADRQELECDGGICNGLGHVDCRGGSIKSPAGVFLNDFGIAHAAAGHEWTQELCEADSDGDGLTNGHELGDPCCVWMAGGAAPSDVEFVPSHPGDADDTGSGTLPNAAECAALRDETGPSKIPTTAELIEGFYNEGEARLSLNYTIELHTLLPNETVYTNMFFNLPADKPYYLVGALAEIDNKVRVHHFVVYLCTEALETFTDLGEGVANLPASAEENGLRPAACPQNIYNWGPGGDVLSMPSDFSLIIEPIYKTLNLEVHYNNVDGVTNETDASSMSLHLTPDPRPKQGSFLWVGSILNTGTIPPKATTFSSTSCILTLKPGCDNITVTGHFPHAHTIGRAIWGERYSRDVYGSLTYETDIGRAMDYAYDAQGVRWFVAPEVVRDGEVLTATCLYDAADRATETRGGLASDDEMCVNFLTYHPYDCTYGLYCRGVSQSGGVPDSVDWHGNSSRITDLATLGTSPDFATLVTSGLLSCNATAVAPLQGSATALDAFRSAWATACAYLETFQGDPETIESVQCSEQCAEYIINFGACAASELALTAEMLRSLGSIEPTWYTMPSCHDHISAKLQALSLESAEDGSGDVGSFRGPGLALVSSMVAALMAAL